MSDSGYEYLVVGLGNPGEEYEDTPHNLGFKIVDLLAETHAIRVSRKENAALASSRRSAAVRGLEPMH